MSQVLKESPNREAWFAVIGVLAVIGFAWIFLPPLLRTWRQGRIALGAWHNRKAIALLLAIWVPFLALMAVLYSLQHWKR